MQINGNPLTKYRISKEIQGHPKGVNIKSKEHHRKVIGKSQGNHRKTYGSSAALVLASVLALFCSVVSFCSLRGRTGRIVDPADIKTSSLSFPKDPAAKKQLPGQAKVKTAIFRVTAPSGLRGRPSDRDPLPRAAGSARTTLACAPRLRDLDGSRHRGRDRP